MKNPTKIVVFFFFTLIITIQAALAYVPLAETKYNQGVAFSEKDNYTMAIQSFEDAVKIDPTFFDAYFNLGVLYEYSKQNEKAIATFEQLLKNNPSDSEAAFKTASLYYKAGQYQKAKSYITFITIGSNKYSESQDLYKKINQQEQKASAPKALTPQIEGVLKDFISPTGISKDSSGNLYIANYGDNSIIKITPDGKKSLIARENRLNGPIGIAVDKANNIYVANYSSNEVLKVDPFGTISVVIKNIQKPYYLYLDNSNTLYVSEQGTNTVVKLKL